MHKEVTLPLVATTSLAEHVGEDRVLDTGIRPLWEGMEPVMGPVFAVRCAPGDNLMMHAAIYRAPAGSVIMADSGGSALAVAGGNVCAVAQRRGIAAFIVDGNIRDIQEAREIGFPVFARGIFPKPGTKKAPSEQGPTWVGGVSVSTGDTVIADEEGIVVVEAHEAEEKILAAAESERREEEQTLDQWESQHRRKIAGLLAEGGEDPVLPV